MYFIFHGLHFMSILIILKAVGFFHVASFNYGAKWVRDVDPTCRCHQSNIMLNSIFRIKIAVFFITCGYLFCFLCFAFCILLCVCVWGWYFGLFLFVETRCSIFLLLHFFFYLGFFSQTFTNHRTAGEGGGHFFNSSLPLPPASQTLRH